MTRSQLFIVNKTDFNAGLILVRQKNLGRRWGGLVAGREWGRRGGEADDSNNTELRDRVKRICCV